MVHPKLAKKFNLNSAKSFIGKNVNLHLTDGITLINVKLEKIENRLLVVRGDKPRARLLFVPLSEVSEITVVEISLFQSKEMF